MKTSTKILFIFSLLVFLACEKNNQVRDTEPDNLMGYWVNPQVNDTIWTFQRSSALKDGQYGFGMQAGQLFVERKNAGWCGTPPIAYADFEGSWTASDSLINITVEYWGGLADYQWKIISIDDNSLTIYKVSEDHHMEDE